MNLNPRLGIVWTNRGLSPLSPSARANLRKAVCEAAIEVDVRVLAPHGVAQLVAADHLAAFREQQRQRLRRLRLERDGAAVLAQLPALVVEFEDAEAINHFGTQRTLRTVTRYSAPMSQINIGGVLKGGLAAGLIMNISEFILNVPVAGAQMDAELLSHNLPPVANGAHRGLRRADVPAGNRHRVALCGDPAAARSRPQDRNGRRRDGVGVVVPRTPRCSSDMLGMQSMGLVVLGVVWSAIEMIVASSVGAYLYKEA